MPQRARQRVGEHFHILVRVRSEAAAGRHPVVVQQPQVREAVLLGILIRAEGKGEAGLQPILPVRYRDLEIPAYSTLMVSSPSLAMRPTIVSPGTTALTPSGVPV